MWQLHLSHLESYSWSVHVILTYSHTMRHSTGGWYTSTVFPSSFITVTNVKEPTHWTGSTRISLCKNKTTTTYWTVYDVHQRPIVHFHYTLLIIIDVVQLPKNAYYMHAGAGTSKSPKTLCVYSRGSEHHKVNHCGSYKSNCRWLTNLLNIFSPHNFVWQTHCIMCCSRACHRMSSNSTHGWLDLVFPLESDRS